MRAKTTPPHTAMYMQKRHPTHFLLFVFLSPILHVCMHSAYDNLARTISACHSHERRRRVALQE